MNNVVIWRVFISKASYTDTVQINVAMELGGVMASWKSNRGHWLGVKHPTGIVRQPARKGNRAKLPEYSTLNEASLRWSDPQRLQRAQLQSRSNGSLTASKQFQSVINKTISQTESVQFDCWLNNGPWRHQRAMAMTSFFVHTGSLTCIVRID